LSWGVKHGEGKPPGFGAVRARALIDGAPSVKLTAFGHGRSVMIEQRDFFPST
jgi:hypothetical protein